MVLLLLLVACRADTDTKTDTDTDTDTDGRGDSGDSANDWPPLSPTAAWTSSDQGYGTGLAWADLDQDGDADLVASYGNDMAPGPVVVYENVEGVLGPSPTWRSAQDHYHGHLSVGDVDGDGWIDVVASVFLGDARWDEPGGVQLYHNDAGILEETAIWVDSGFYTFANALGDIDLDGDLDLAVAVGEAYQHDPDLSRVYTNDGAGNFSLSWTTESPRHSFDVGWTDLDGDGWLDLVFANNDTPHTATLNDGGTLQADPAWQAEGTGFEGNTLDWGDVDGDGTVDLVVSDNNQLGGSGTVRLYCGAGLDLCWESADAPAMQSAVSLEDVDGDGRLDLAAGAWWGAVRIYAHEGDTFEATPSWVGDRDDIVVEAFSWEDVDGSHDVTVRVEGERLVAVPGRILAVEGGVGGDRWASGPGTLSVDYLAPSPRDLAVTDWTRESGNLLYGR